MEIWCHQLSRFLGKKVVCVKALVLAMYSFVGLDLGGDHLSSETVWVETVNCFLFRLVSHGRLLCPLYWIMENCCCAPGLLLVGIFTLSSGLSISNYINAADRARLKSLFSQPPSDLAAAHYSALGLVRLGIPVPPELCLPPAGKTEVEALYHSSVLSKLSPKCKAPAVDSAKPILAKSIREGVSILELYHAVLAQANLGIEVDSAQVSKILTGILENDDSISNLGYSFHIASHLKGNLQPYFDRIEDAIVQADEVNGKYLQFEGGLSITANILSGVFKLAHVHKKAPPLTSEQAIKFTNYLLSRKYVQAIKGASQLLNLLAILTNNPSLVENRQLVGSIDGGCVQYHVPVAITPVGSTAISTKSPQLEVQVTDVLGKPLPQPLTVTADSMVRRGDNKQALSKVALTLTSPGHYKLDVSSSKPPRGFYKLSVSAQPTKGPDPRLGGNTGALLNVKVLTELSLPHVELGIEDRDDSIASKMNKVSYPQTLPTTLEADYHQKLVIRFSLYDHKSKMAAHQVFAYLTPAQSTVGGKEVVIVAEIDPSTGVYKVELDLLAKSKDFSHISGLYDLSLVVGDAVISSPIVWKLAMIIMDWNTGPVLRLPYIPRGGLVRPLWSCRWYIVGRSLHHPGRGAVFSQQSQEPSVAQPIYEPKPVIRHLFRPQEKRAPAALSTAFSVLVIVVPWLPLLVMWAWLGVNLSDIVLAPLPAVSFHLGLSGIFALFACCWVNLNMFTTIKYLSWIGFLTFLSGHRLFTQLAATKVVLYSILSSADHSLTLCLQK
ncbi:RPN2 [Cordylochernes scorpioides]|uniref:Dolichyl-diphosphooligosaccharide--protein glycosyltransferase subunit 2 n=1 Tax=Cordylochernes scorpioides TaxID=51811 RepID=A0ABY6LB98_9ARAC|nr:RPN2 [Cordylochernes scorpioides]